ncbi:MAG: hypothetical protein BWY42_01576 [Candidatus Omnitrophica bacterium ADurb.Bin277]|nr:MAG: hypothetical protein BWY42_01576 [Candidatus Omnitrophica bacterium ADurb.Bin277]
MRKPRSMFAVRRPVKAVILPAILAVLSGCGTTPVPLPVFSGDVRGEHIKSITQAPPGHFGIVMKCIAENIEENAGLKIAGMIAEEGESPYVFAAPEKSGGLLVVRIKEIGIVDPASAIRMTLQLRVFDASGQNIYTRNITGLSGADPPQHPPPGIEEALQTVTKDILRQYAKDPVLRPLILKYKLGSLLKFG